MNDQRISTAEAVNNVKAMTSGSGSVIPTPWWMTVYGADLTLHIDGRTRIMPVGTQINFFIDRDSERIYCGTGRIRRSDNPKYQTLLLHTPIYRDDWTSPNVVEGPVEGEQVHVAIGDPNRGLNGMIPVVALGADGKERELVYQTNVFENGRYGIRLIGFHAIRLRGDIDGDGRVTPQDLQTLVDAVVTRQAIPPDELVIYDVNGDGKVDHDDIDFLVEHIFRGGPLPDRAW